MIRYEDGSLRYFTVYEAKLIQTFPKDYIVTGSWGEAMRQIGNAVPVAFATKIGSQLYKTICPKPLLQPVSSNFYNHKEIQNERAIAV